MVQNAKSYTTVLLAYSNHIPSCKLLSIHVASKNSIKDYIRL